MAKHRTDADEEGELVFLERVQLLHSKGLAALATVLVNSAVLVLAVWHSVSHLRALSWLGVLYAVTIVRIVDWRRHPATRRLDEARRWAVTWMAGAFVTGVLWGSAALLLLPADSVGGRYLVLFVIGGMVAGASASWSSYWPGFVLFAAPALALPIARLVLMGGVEHATAAFLLAVFGAAMGAIARTSGHALEEGLRLRIRNSLLVEQLSTAKDQLTRMNQELEARVAGRTQDLQEALEQRDQLITEREKLLESLRDADRRKDEFIAGLSHELRNPLAPIRNSLHILGRAVPGGEQARRALAVIDRQVGHMSRLIDDLLDVTRIARGKAELHRERIDLCELTRGTVEDYRGAFVASGVELRLSTEKAELWVYGDRTRLAQAVGNLLQNAVKFTPRGGATVVSVRADATRDRVILQVEDSGRGIPAEFLPRIFEPFTQADTTLDRRMGGLGLGLALVKGVVEMHRGSVDASSAGTGKGATFSIALPLEKAGRVQPAEHHLEGRAARRVLVIEDNADAAESLREVLELNGHEVATARDGPEGIDRARSFRPDVVLCDIGLPGIDGYEVARTLRADPELDQVVLVALTGYASPEDVARARAAGFDDHLAKPAGVETLETALGRAPRTAA